MWFSRDFQPLSKDFRRFTTNGPQARQRFLNICWRFQDIIFPKISEDCWRQLKKIQRCFKHTATNLSVVKGANDHFSKMISSYVRISHCFYQFTCYHSVYQWLLYSKNNVYTGTPDQKNVLCNFVPREWPNNIKQHAWLISRV